jgi:hypothetical protein
MGCPMANAHVGGPHHAVGSNRHLLAKAPAIMKEKYQDIRFQAKALALALALGGRRSVYQ